MGKPWENGKTMGKRSEKDVEICGKRWKKHEKVGLSYKAPTKNNWLETIGEAHFFKVDGTAYYGQSLKGTKDV